MFSTMLKKKKSMKNIKISEPLTLEEQQQLHSPTYPQHSLQTSPTQRAFPITSDYNNNNNNNQEEPPVILVSKFDFKAENQHELTVGVGEALKLIQRKGNGWILVKPIGRLAEPGLIPASYVKIVRLPMGESKNTEHDPWVLASPNKNPQEEHNHAQHHVPSRKASSSNPSLSSYPITGHGDRGNSSHQLSLGSVSTTEEHFSFQSNSSSNRTSISINGEQSSGICSTKFRASSSLSHKDRYPCSGLVRNASCHNGRYWYRVDITMNDGSKRYLSRYYQDFYKLHCMIVEHLREQFDDTDDAFNEMIMTNLPKLPDPIPRPDLQTLSSILLQRVQSLNVYIFKIVKNKSQLNYSKILNSWTNPRMGDLEVGLNDQLSNEEIENVLQPVSSKILKSKSSSSGIRSPISSCPPSPTKETQSYKPSHLTSPKDEIPRQRPSLNIATSVTPALGYSANTTIRKSSSSGLINSTSSSQDFTASSSPTNSPMVWSSPTFQMNPSWQNSEVQRIPSTPTIHENEVFHDWLEKPTEPLNCTPRNSSTSTLSYNNKVSQNIKNQPTYPDAGDEYIKVKIFANDDIFALRLSRSTKLHDLKRSILTRLECDVNTAMIKLYYKNQAKNNYFIPLNDELELNTCFDQPKVSIKVHIWSRQDEMMERL